MEYYDDNLEHVRVKKQMVNRKLELEALDAFLGIPSEELKINELKNIEPLKVENQVENKVENKVEKKVETSSATKNFKLIVQEYVQNTDDSICGLIARTKDSSQAVFGFFNEVENLQPDLISESHEIRYEFSTNSVKVIRGNKKVKVKLSEDILKLLYMKRWFKCE